MPSTASWLAGASVAITGADRPPGRAISASFASHGVDLALMGTSTAALGTTADEVSRIRALHQNEATPLLIDGDAATPEGMATLERSAVATFGPLDALVHVVEISEPAVLAATTAAVLAVAGRGLISQGGSLVIAVLAGPWRPAAQANGLAETTSALEGMVRGAARAWHGRVAVNGVVLEANGAPQTRALGFEAFSRAALPTAVAPQTGDFDQAARVIRFLASREAQALTGQTLTVGRTLAEAA
ncbi:MAG: SDR family oxidoreductase [Bacteroidota bacterium]